MELLGNTGIHDLGDRADRLHVADCHHDGLSQILIALDVGRDADLMDDLGHAQLKVQVAWGLGRLDARRLPGQAPLADTAGQHLCADRLAQEMAHAQAAALGRSRVAGKGRHHKNAHLVPVVNQAVHNAQPVQLGQHQVDEQQVGRQLAHLVQRGQPVPRRSDNLDAVLRLQSARKRRAEVLVSVRNYYPNVPFHVVTHCLPDKIFCLLCAFALFCCRFHAAPLIYHIFPARTMGFSCFQAFFVRHLPTSFDIPRQVSAFFPPVF